MTRALSEREGSAASPKRGVGRLRVGAADGNLRRWLLWVSLFAGLTHGGNYFLRPDSTPQGQEREYIHLAVNFAESGELRLPVCLEPSGEWLTGEAARRAPLYPCLLSRVYLTQPVTLWINGAMAIQTFLAWCNALLAALIAARIAGDRAGLLAGLFSAIYGPFLYLQMSLLTGTLLITLVLSALLLYIVSFVELSGRTTNRRRGDAAKRIAALIGVSILLGLAGLTRAEAFVLVIPFAVDAALRRGTLPMRAACLLAVAAPAIWMGHAWCLRNEQAADAYTLTTTSGLHFFLGANDVYAAAPGDDQVDLGLFGRMRMADRTLSEGEANRRLMASGLAFVQENPGLAAVNALRKMGLWFRPQMPSAGPIAPIAALIVIVLAGRRRYRLGLFDARRNAVYRIIFGMLAAIVLYWLFQRATSEMLYIEGRPPMLPVLSPLYVLSLGAPAVLLLRGDLRLRGLFIGIIASFLAVVGAFLPLTQLRWAIDPLLIIALAVGVANVCRWLEAADGSPVVESESSVAIEGASATAPQSEPPVRTASEPRP